MKSLIALALTNIVWIVSYWLQRRRYRALLAEAINVCGHLFAEVSRPMSDELVKRCETLIRKVKGAKCR